MSAKKQSVNIVVIVGLYGLLWIFQYLTDLGNYVDCRD